jgi:hypothetical protein
MKVKLCLNDYRNLFLEFLPIDKQLLIIEKTKMITKIEVKDI